MPRPACASSCMMQVAVACGTLKGGRADWLVEKVAELGAKALIPLLTERSPEVADGRASRLDRVAQAAAKQCLRTHALQVEAPARIQALVDRMEQSPLVLLATEGASPLMTVLSSHPQVSALGQPPSEPRRRLELRAERMSTARR